MTIFFQCRG